MDDKDIALEALSTLCNANVTSIQNQSLQAGTHGADVSGGAPFRMSVSNAFEISQESSSFVYLEPDLQGSSELLNNLDNQYDKDFTKLTGRQIYQRGGEVYRRPYGWYRHGIKVLGKYESDAWLGNQKRSTESVPGEWPVSYHGTSMEGAEGIIYGSYKPGPGQVHGRGVYSTPYISEAEQYAKTFISKKNKKKYKVILQNRINEWYRRVCKKNDRYWLVPIPAGTSARDEQKMVKQAIRPYGLLLKEVK